MLVPLLTCAIPSSIIHCCQCHSPLYSDYLNYTCVYMYVCVCATQTPNSVAVALHVKTSCREKKKSRKNTLIRFELLIALANGANVTK